MRSEGLESRLIGTVAQCPLCNPSKKWMGHQSPEYKIRKSGIWQVQHLKSEQINPEHKKIIDNTIYETIHCEFRNVR